MKIAIRARRSELASEASSETSKDAPSQFSEWPQEFVDFLQRVGNSPQVVEARVDIANRLTTLAHGNSGAAIAWTIDVPLAESWRVAAHHSNLIAELDSFNSNQLEKADGIVTTGPNFSYPLAINTADCLAVAMTSEINGTIEVASCFHAGWRGYVSGIQQLAFERIRTHVFLGTGSQKSNSELHVTIGPSISGRSYPCGSDVLQALRDHHEQRLKSKPGWGSIHEKAFWGAVGLERFSTHGKIYPDLQAIMCIELHALGVNLDSVSVFREDTYESSWWPSHRRAMAQGLERAGRLVTHLCPPACPQVPNHDSNP